MGYLIFIKTKTMMLILKIKILLIHYNKDFNIFKKILKP